MNVVHLFYSYRPTRPLHPTYRWYATAIKEPLSSHRNDHMELVNPFQRYRKTCMHTHIHEFIWRTISEGNYINRHNLQIVIETKSLDSGYYESWLFTDFANMFINILCVDRSFVWIKESDRYGAIDKHTAESDSAYSICLQVNFSLNG